jgi:hypothetical protein
MDKNEKRDENENTDARTRGTTGQRGNALQGTQEREERITGSVGVENRKGETIHQGSTTGAKGGPGIGTPDQGEVKEAPGSPEDRRAQAQRPSEEE